MSTSIAASFLKELEMETLSTRKCLERIPADKYEFKPHPSSMNLGYLTLLVAEIPLWIAYTIEKSVIDFGTFPHVDIKSTEAMVKHFDENIARAKKALSNLPDEAFQKTFELRNKGQVLVSEPTLNTVGSSINHWVHHRGQLTVYMRMNEIEVPSIYGPSGDDNKFQKGAKI